jgi:hypothetical protein
MAQRNGHGKALRTAMRGALIVNRRINKRSLIKRSPDHECKQPPELAFRWLFERSEKINAC